MVKRKDGLFAYQLASVVDDGTMGITDVVRGADLIESTPRQIALFEALGYEPPRFWHLPLMRDEDGNLMSKRDGSESLARWKAEGKHAPDVVGFLASSLGLIDRPVSLSAGELLQSLTTARLESALCWAS